ASDWTDQECGMAIILNQKIIPISVDKTTPYGFMNKYQALKGWGTFDDTFSKLILTMFKMKVLSLDDLITNLAKTFDFSEVKLSLKLLMDIEEEGTVFSKAQVNTIAKLLKEDYSISRSYFASSLIKEFLAKHKSEIT
ncbi:MAG: hypothetical protein KGH72_05135, partial [Candidatus Micrarchaeota archaeon]|nr:hypothetical protein [Candidatus Micrarchaeota archaeon]